MVRQLVVRGGSEVSVTNVGAVYKVALSMNYLSILCTESGDMNMHQTHRNNDTTQAGMT